MSTLDLLRALFDDSLGYVYQLHVEGPTTAEFTDPSGAKALYPDWTNPDAVRSDQFWSPIDELIAPGGSTSTKTWGDLADELNFPDDLRAMYAPDTLVKEWADIAQEKGLDATWGQRTQFSAAQIPEDADFTIRPVAPIPGATGGGTEVVFDGAHPFDEGWKVVDGAEVPDLADQALADLPTDPLQGVIELADRMGNPADPRYRLPEITDEMIDAQQRDNLLAMRQTAEAQAANDPAGATATEGDALQAEQRAGTGITDEMMDSWQRDNLLAMRQTAEAQAANDPAAAAATEGDALQAEQRAGTGITDEMMDSWQEQNIAAMRQMADAQAVDDPVAAAMTEDSIARAESVGEGDATAVADDDAEAGGDADADDDDADSDADDDPDPG